MGLVSEDAIEWTDYDRGDAHFRRKQFRTFAGGEDLGASLYELPPDGRSWPYHYHTANEEALFVLSGEGRLRIAGEERDLTAGDYVAFPAGPEGAHRVSNDGDDPLRYLVVSTMIEPDITVYPDRGTFGVFVGSPPGHDEERTLEGFYRIEDDVPYWDESR